jgi:hypothetical protein
MVFTELGTASSEAAPLPIDACGLFGPDVPPAIANQPPGRPVDADSTGGYYQPTRLVAGSQIAIGMVRITCGVPGASPEQFAELTADTHPNENPAIDTVSAGALGNLVTADLGTNTVQPSQVVNLQAAWASCPPSAPGCTGSEWYAYLDPVTQAVVRTREEMRLSWFASGGTFAVDRTGRDAMDPTPYTDNTWTAPSAPGVVNVWLVLRDDRGGVGWRSYTFRVGS